MLKLRLFFILCACITIVVFTWWSVLLIGVCTIIYYLMKLILAKYGKPMYNYFENLFK